MVTTLCDTIRESQVAIINDRFFTSVYLMQTLPFACVGTVMTGRRNLPDLSGKLQRGQSKSMCTDDGVICFKWQDSKEVNNQPDHLVIFSVVPNPYYLQNKEIRLRLLNFILKFLPEFRYKNFVGE